MTVKRNEASCRNLDASGGKLPSIPMSRRLADALEAEASVNLRSPRDQARVIIEMHFGLYRGDKIIRAEASDAEVSRSLFEIERMSGGAV
ncbi:MAG: hypothetical protein AABN33_10965 [Acidobacteriota bacterium]